jgi:hypothetical protein
MLKETQEIGLELIVGYLNSEATVVSLISSAELTFGAFENTRIFSIDKFLQAEEGQRGPRARIYLPGLFNWVQVGQAREIRDHAPDVWSEIYWPTDYSEEVMTAAVEPHFNQPALYKHYFLCLAQQLGELATLDVVERYRKLRADLREAERYYQQIDDIPIDLELHGQGGHIQPWLGAINSYYRSHLRA